MKTPPSPQPALPERDRELLSAYLDNEVTPTERAELERRLEQEPALRQELAELGATRAIVREQPWLSPPRSFALTPEMVGQRRRRWPLAGWWQPLSGLAALVLVMLIGWQVFQPLNDSSSPAAISQMTAREEAVAPTAEAAMQPEERRDLMLAPAAASVQSDGSDEPSTNSVAATAPPAQAFGMLEATPEAAPDKDVNAAQPATAPSSSPAPPPPPLAIALAVLLLIAAGIWLARRAREF